jgi:triacylglycerol esterase/lipase EstA (alpha/beta hydrolase family)
MAMIEGLSPNSRIHVIFIPGFAGFDALGQFEYYAGVTPLFHSWQRKHKDRATAVLHYFDNFPTAAVATRSELLRQYIVKRIARGEFTSDDRIALVGHSTGGLDIRLLLWDLAHSSDRILTDGGRGKAVEVDRDEVLRQVDRLVLISVPQWGKNIADWVHTYRIERHLVLAELRAAVTASQVFQTTSDGERKETAC